MNAGRAPGGVPLPDVVALTAIAWVVAAVLHEGLGHGVACIAMGGDPVRWSTFHFDCDRRLMSVGAWRVVSAAGTAVNLALVALGYAWWRQAADNVARLAAWIVVAVNGLTSFGYLVFSAAFGIGDWNAAGVMSGVADHGVTRVALGGIGVAGYYAVIRLAATMLVRMPPAAATPNDASRLVTTVWLTTGLVSLMAGLTAGTDWRVTLGASVGAALGGNAGLFSVPRFVSRRPAAAPPTRRASTTLVTIATVLVAGFVAILGPGVALRGEPLTKADGTPPASSPSGSSPASTVAPPRSSRSP